MKPKTFRKAEDLFDVWPPFFKSSILLMFEVIGKESAEYIIAKRANYEVPPPQSRGPMGVPPLYICMGCLREKFCIITALPFFHLNILLRPLFTQEFS